MIDHRLSPSIFTALGDPNVGERKLREQSVYGRKE